ncbi:hypothetical protein [Sphingopyxis macrogoltabida]|uniref:Uncharacterized protein n=1 Tax=Sphingopyxis macrogoltabida TaxID=33050 RepID=A0A0N9U5E2_SPHMC|nr:hypothetical protein [Sphingopyxis macrogoltabida]ALH80393.1 hypothetical protein AN936_08435 [Sphingopyxis macrogoltabida]
MKDGRLTEAELLAIQGMQEGVLEPLADLLGELLTESKTLADPIPLDVNVVRGLIRAINGEARETDHRLKFVRHPDLKAGQGRAARHKAFVSELAIALEMEAAGAFDRGGHESAVRHCADKFGIARSTVQKAWSNRKAFLKFTRAHGVRK